MSLGLPNFNFIFQSKGVSAIERSARGIVAVILKDDTEGEEQNVYNKVDDVDFTQWTEDNYNYLKLIYEGAPSKVIAMRVATNVESYNAVLKKLKDLKWNYLCIPGIKAADTTMIGAWIKQYRNDEKKTFKVVLPHYAGDHEGIINFTTENITSSVTGKKHTAAEYCARIAGILAGLSLSRSSTFYVLNDVSSAEVPDDPNERIDAGELILTFDGSQYKIGRGVNSLTSLPLKRKIFGRSRSWRAWISTWMISGIHLKSIMWAKSSMTMTTSRCLWQPSALTIRSFLGMSWIAVMTIPYL